MCNYWFLVSEKEYSRKKYPFSRVILVCLCVTYVKKNEEKRGWKMKMYIFIIKWKYWGGNKEKRMKITELLCACVEGKAFDISLISIVLLLFSYFHHYWKLYDRQNVMCVWVCVCVLYKERVREHWVCVSKIIN